MTYTSKPKTQNFIDFHSHLLPGLDDGAEDLAEAVKMARILARSGFTGAFCTPHLIRGCHDQDSHSMAAAVGKLQGLLGVHDIDLRLFEGREYCLDEFLMGYMNDPVQGFGGYLLVEIPSLCPPEMVRDTLYRLRCKGYIPLIAHPERCSLLSPPARPGKSLTEWLRICRSAGKIANAKSTTQSSESRFENRNQVLDSTSLIEYLKNLNCLFQGNIGSFAGIYGDAVRRRAVRFLQDGLYSCLGSDAHRSRNLGEWLEKGMREIERIAGREGLRDLLKGLPVEAGAEKQISVKGDLRL